MQNLKNPEKYIGERMPKGIRFNASDVGSVKQYIDVFYYIYY